MSTAHFRSRPNYRQPASGMELIPERLVPGRRSVIAGGSVRDSESWKTLERTVVRRSMLPLASKQLWRIEQGVVRTLAHSGSDEMAMVLGFWGEGSVVGLPLAGDVALQVECLTKVKAALVTTEIFADPQVLLSHLQQQSRLMAILRRGRMGDRLLEFLTWFAQEFGYSTHQGWSVPSLLTHQELAETLNCSRVTVTRLLNTAVKEGKVLRSRGELIIPAEGALRTGC
ncbi:MAG: Crp/Fnr family transcriptional regulator [Cyanophyceae cyanobacterium]